MDGAWNHIITALPKIHMVIGTDGRLGELTGYLG